MALEADKKIFLGVLEPMKKIAPPIAIVAVPQAPLVVISQDPDAMVVKARKFVRRDRPSK